MPNRVPPTRETTNREQRRHPERAEEDEARAAEPTPPQSNLRDQRQSRPQDTDDPRAKSSGHGKKTADKWNQ